jgi:phage gp46-like protein
LRGVEPIVAAVILVVVTPVVAIGVVGWLMGWWGGMRQAESLVIHLGSKLHANGKVIPHVENKGSVATVIYNGDPRRRLGQYQPV